MESVSIRRNVHHPHTQNQKNRFDRKRHRDWVRHPLTGSYTQKGQTAIRRNAKKGNDSGESKIESVGNKIQGDATPLYGDPFHQEEKEGKV